MRSCSPAGRRLAGRRSCMYYMCMRVGVYVRFACVRQRSCFFCFLVVCGFCFFFFLLRPPLSQSGIFVFLHYVNSRPVCVTGSPGGLNLLQEKKRDEMRKRIPTWMSENPFPTYIHITYTHDSRVRVPCPWFTPPTPFIYLSYPRPGIVIAPAVRRSSLIRVQGPWSPERMRERHGGLGKT